MDKLASYLDTRDTVTAEDIDAVCTRSTECTVFQMVDAQVAGNTQLAFSLLRDMVRSGEDRIGILAMLLRQYRILYHMRCLLDERTPPNAQGQLLGIPPFSVGRTQQQAGLPLRMCELLATVPCAVYVERVMLNNPANIRKAKKAVQTALDIQEAGLGFTFVEFLSACPTNWGLAPADALKWLEDNMAAYYPIGNFRKPEGY